MRYKVETLINDGLAEAPAVEVHGGVDSVLAAIASELDDALAPGLTITITVGA